MDAPNPSSGGLIQAYNTQTQAQLLIIQKVPSTMSHHPVAHPCALLIHDPISLIPPPPNRVLLCAAVTQNVSVAVDNGKLALPHPAVLQPGRFAAVGTDVSLLSESAEQPRHGV